MTSLGLRHNSYGLKNKKAAFEVALRFVRHSLKIGDGEGGRVSVEIITEKKW